MRTIPQTVEYFRKIDPMSYLNPWYLRSLVNSGVLPCHRAGKKRILINLDALEAYLANPPAQLIEVETTYGKIRRIGG